MVARPFFDEETFAGFGLHVGFLIRILKQSLLNKSSLGTNRRIWEWVGFPCKIKERTIFIVVGFSCFIRKVVS